MKAATAPSSHVHSGKLDWRLLLKWLREDQLISVEDAEQTQRRFAGGHSSQHALIRLASANLIRKGTAKELDVEALTEWLAGRCGLPYLRIDPLRVDVGRVTDVMSITYAERRH